MSRWMSSSVGTLSLHETERPRRLVASSEEDPHEVELAGALLLLGDPPREVRAPHQPRECGQQDERAGSLGVRGREQQAHRCPVEDPEERRTGRSGGIHDRPNVVHPHLERWLAGDAIGHAHPAPVENDQPRKRRQPPRNLAALVLHRPGELDVGDRRHEDDVEGAVADHLIGDRNVTAPCVACLRAFHGGQPRRVASPGRL